MYSDYSISEVKSKMVTLEVVEKFVVMKKHGTNYLGICPFHSEKSPSFYVSPVKNIYKCFGCGKSGDAIAFLMESQNKTFPEAIRFLAEMYSVSLSEESKSYVRPVFKNNTTLSDGIVKWFESRGISQKTLLSKQVTEGVESMLVKGEDGKTDWKDIKTVQFNYFRDGELINTKYRGPKKEFKLHKGAELILYNVDSLKGKKEALIVEGEIDMLSLIEAGIEDIYGIVSVPNGASIHGNNNLAYLNIDDFKDIEKIHLGVDNDMAGRRLRDELSERFGKDRCDIIEWKDKKDANDVLKQYGIEGIHECVGSPVKFPLEGAFTISDISYEIEDMYKNGLDRGVDIGLKDFMMRFVRGYITVVTGQPGFGKSEAVDEIALRLLVRHGWRGAFYSPENKPTQLHFSKLACRLIGKRWDGEGRMSDAEKNMAKNYLDKKIWFIKPEKDFTLSSILDAVKRLKERYGLDFFVIDAWNKLEHKGAGDTDYIGRTLDELAVFCELNSLHCFLVAHPTKMEKDKKTDQYIPATLYNIAGSANFKNKADNGLSIYRDMETGKSVWHRLKIKFKHWGWIGNSSYSYDDASGRYFDGVLPDTSNWITGKSDPKQVVIGNIDDDNPF